MKLQSATFVVTILVLLAAACTSQSPKSPEMPAQRPEDFMIEFSEVGGSENNGARYVVNAKSASYMRKLFNGDVGVANFKPSEEDLDSLYAFVRASGITGIHAQTEGDSSDRFGYRMEIVYAGNTFSLTDQGNQYIRLEADYNKFKDVLAEVRAFVGKGLEKYKFELTVKVVLDSKAPRPDSLSVVLEKTSLIDLQSADKPGDTLQGSFTALNGTYQIAAFAKVDSREWAWSKEILLLQPMLVHLQLGKSGFQEIVEGIEK